MTTYRQESDIPMVGGDVPGAPHAGDTTRWFYDEPSGCMTNKVYADGKGPSYSYTPDGRLARRTWARGIVTDYTYDNAGKLTRTEYDDNGVTPTITMAYDRVGNLVNATTAGVVTNLYAYDLQGHCTNEWQNDFNLTRYYDTLGRSTGYAINGTRQITIVYDTYGRIATMRMAEGRSGVLTASNENEFVWSYLPNTDLKASLQYPNGLTASWAYDANNQLLQVCNATPTNVISQFDYTYDAAGRRTAITKTGSAFGDLSGSIDAYTYNARSELTSARRTKNGQPVPGFSEDFDYDPIGNRRSSATYNEKGETQTSTYQANNLNQYTQRTTPGYAAVRGEADPNATVTVNENPAFRLGSYYFGSDLFDNTASSGFANLETYATLAQTAANGEETEDLVSSTTNQVYLAQSSETFAYDEDGNQTLITTKTGLWRVTYNGENRPILWVRDSDNTTLTMSYDHMSRRRQKNDQRFFYEGYLQVADNSGNVYVWDCTETVATRPLSWLNTDSVEYYAHDGNKDVSEVVSSSVSITAHYEYAPFGSVILQFGESVIASPWRFSSEYSDDELGCDYYNYREYEPMMGRWLWRDPIEDLSGQHSYIFECNAPTYMVDPLGLLALNLSFSWGPTRKSFMLGPWFEGDISMSGNASLSGEYNNGEIQGLIKGISHAEVGGLVGKSFEMRISRYWHVMGRAGIRLFVGAEGGVTGSFKYNVCTGRGSAEMEFPLDIYGGAEVIAKLTVYKYYKWGNQYGGGYKMPYVYEIGVAPIKVLVSGGLKGKISCDEKVCNLRSVVNANVNLSAELKLWGWGVSVSQDVFKGERALTDVVLQSPLRLLEK